MGRYDKEIKMVFNRIEKLETIYYLPEDSSFLYKNLYEATIPDADIENFCQKLSALLELESMDDIKAEIRQLLKFYSYDVGFSKLDLM